VFYVVSQTNPETKQVSNVLIKRGKKLHEPDRMNINPNQIVFVEMVGTNSTVAHHIARGCTNLVLRIESAIRFRSQVLDALDQLTKQSFLGLFVQLRDCGRQNVVGEMIGMNRRVATASLCQAARCAGSV
jgi:hypothetical protein